MKYCSRLLAICVCSLFSHSVQAVTCSCASVPLLNSMATSAPDPGTWFFSYNYEFRDLSEAIRGSDIIDDGTDRDRTTESMIIEISRGITPEWTVSSLFSYVTHEREIGGGDRQVSQGPGDAILMAKYSPFKIRVYSRNSVTFGLGARVPFGEHEVSSNSILLAEDMQPSNGAWAAIGWVHYARTFSQQANLQVYSTLSHTYNFDNNRDYQFGNETSIEVGSSYQLNSPLGFVAGIRYRHSDRDQRSNVEIPNTGGKWIDLIPGVQYHFNPNLAGKLSATIPLWRDLNDTIQFTTKNAVTLSASYLF